MSRRSCPSMPVHASNRQRGLSLLIVLLLLIAAVFLGVSAAVIALQTEKAARGDRDRQVAFQAAEAAMIDAQRDIDTAGTPSPGARPLPMGRNSAAGFPASDDATICNAASDPVAGGLCQQALPAARPSWLAVDLAASGSGSVSVAYGTYTQQKYPVNSGILPARLPRYIIELMPFVQPGATAQVPSFAYRITAIGFGTDINTQVVLQAFYRKED